MKYKRSTATTLRLFHAKGLISINEETRSKGAIHAQRLRRWLPEIAKDLGLALEPLTALVEQSAYQCAVCFGPIRKLFVYRDADGVPRGAICGYCDAAIERAEGDLVQLSRQTRFSRRLINTRMRLGRFVALHSKPSPFE